MIDEPEDRKTRPQRPLPRNAFSLLQAERVAVTALFIALGLCGFAGIKTLGVGVALAGSVFTYNRVSKKTPISGPLNMGLCRGLSFLLGVAAVSEAQWPGFGIWAPFFFIIAYIAAVTRLAARETDPPARLVEAWLPFFFTALFFILFFQCEAIKNHPFRAGMMIPPAFLSLLSAFGGIRLTLARFAFNREKRIRKASNSHPLLPATIGLLISGQLFWQAAFILAAGQGRGLWVFAFLLLLLWPLNRILSRRFI